MREMTNANNHGNAHVQEFTKINSKWIRFSGTGMFAMFGIHHGNTVFDDANADLLL